MSAHKLRLDDLGVRLVGVGFEPNEVTEFLLYLMLVCEQGV